MKLPLLFLLLALWASIRPSGAAPVLVIQGDKTYQFRAVVVADGGKWIASNDHGGGGIKIFDGRAGLQWGEFAASAGASPLRFTPDATRLLTTPALDALNGDQTQVSLCAVPTGRKLRSFAISPYPVWCDNTRLRGLRDGILVEFDLKSGRQNFRREIEDAPRDGRYGPRFAFSNNGAFLVEGSAGTIRFWQVRNGKLLGRITGARRAIGKAAISNDGEWIATEGDDPKWSPPTDGPMTEAAYARNFRLHVWNARTRQVTRTFAGYYSLAGGARLLAFSPNARTLFGAGNGGLDRFSITSGKNAPLPPPKDLRNGIHGPLDASSDGLWLASVGRIDDSGSFRQGLQLWSLRSSRLLARFGGTLGGGGKVLWSPDGKYLASGLTLWDARTGKLLAQRPNAYAFDFSWLDATTIRSQTLGKVQVWSVPDLKLQSEIDFSPPRTDDYASSEYSGGLSIAPDGRTVLTTDTAFGGGLKGELWVWEAAGKKLLRRIRTDKTWGYTEFSQLLWLPDSRHVVFSTKTKLILLDTQTGAVEKEQADPTNPDFKESDFDFKGALLPLRASPDGKWLAVRAARDGQVLIFDLQTFALNPRAGVQWWQASTAYESRLRVAGAPQGESALSPDSRLVAFGSDGVTRNNVSIWNVRQAREVVRLYLVSGNSPARLPDWIALTPFGYYDASPAGEKRLRWREGRVFWPLAKSRARFKRPSQIALALKPRA